MAAPADESPRIRLSIGHLMLWTLGSAVILACFRGLDSGREDFPARIALVRPYYHLAYSLTLGAQVGSLVLFALRRLTGKSGFPSQPGHWLLLVEGISAALMIAGSGLFFLFRSEDNSSLYLLFAFQLPNLTACTVLYCLAFAKTAKGSPWRYALAIFALMHGIQGLLCALTAVSLYVERRPWLGIWQLPQNCTGLVLGMTILVASLLDWRRHAERDVLHWTGVTTIVANQVLHLVYWSIATSNWAST